MEPLIRLTAVACAMPRINIDTDQILPARFMKQARTPPTGYSTYLFHDARRGPDSAPDPSFALNLLANAGARIIAARRNFGSGSSREAAVYALVDSGSHCVIAPSHGDIFAANAVNDGLLPARGTESDIEMILELLAPGGISAHVDLQTCLISIGDKAFAFGVDPVANLRLLNGWDEIDMTRRYADDIARWSAADRLSRPWAAVPSEPEG
ncbi:MAG: 3-isopropylmalate dehydratase small subunit [Dehalococcoidia bacterium]